MIGYLMNNMEIYLVTCPTLSGSWAIDSTWASKDLAEARAKERTDIYTNWAVSGPWRVLEKDPKNET